MEHVACAEPGRGVLVVSHEWRLDFEEVRELLAAGFEAIHAVDAFHAIRQYATRRISAVVLNRCLPDIEVSELITYFRRHDEALPIVMLSTTMPVVDIPREVDAVIQKYGCATLLPPTLEVLLGTRTAHRTKEDSLAQAA